MQIIKKLARIPMLTFLFLFSLILVTSPSNLLGNNTDCVSLRVNEFCIAAITTGSILDLEFSPDGKTLAMVGPFFRATILNMPDGTLFKRSSDNLDFGNKISFSPDGKRLAVGGDRGINFWNIATNTHEYFEVGDHITALQFSPNGEILGIGIEDGLISIMDSQTGEVISTAIDNTRPFASSIIDLDFSQDGSLLASNSTEASRIWNAENLEIVQTLVANLNLPLGNIEFSPNDQFIAHGDKEPSVPLWDISNVTEASLVRRFPTLANGDLGASAAAFSPNGEQIAVGAFDYDEGTPALRLWNVKSGEMDSELLGIGSAIDHVSFSADGTFVAAATNSLNAGGTSNHLIVWRLK